MYSHTPSSNPVPSSCASPTWYTALATIPTKTMNAPNKPKINGAMTLGRPPRSASAPTEMTMNPPRIGSRLNIAYGTTSLSQSPSEKWLMSRDRSAGCWITAPRAELIANRPRPVNTTPRIGNLRPLATAMTSAANPNTGTAYTNVAGWLNPKPIQLNTPVLPPKPARPYW